MQGSISGAITVLEEVVAPLGAKTTVCGHGPVAGPEVVDQVLSYLRFVQNTAREAKSGGLSPLDGAAPGAPIDVPAAIGDMIAYNGGEPLSCHA